MPTEIVFKNPPWGRFLKIVFVGIPTHTGMKTSFYADFSSLETGFRAGIGRNANWNNL